jgi:hypothetical protein
MTRLFPAYVGGPLDGEPVSITPKGEKHLQVPHSPDFDLTDPTARIEFEIVNYRRETIRMKGASTELDAWIEEGVSDDEAAEIVWNHLLSAVGAYQEY